MRLLRVELLGFKSFADKTVFDFSDGITAILGPNGCGKSNVVDAVKWVLGEQSARNLRGAEMADVIFSGSEQRKPLGLAEVSLVFDNSDGLLPSEYNEVCVTRRLYRSGESEYLLNGLRCRLRDIRDLFMDTGIGTSAYSFIEQGKVEALLSAKPQERRLVFEEAAGISKYKARRKEAQARLERTQQYLLRVNDIVEEVEKRIRSVTRQAQSARRYQRLTGELQHAKGRLYHARWLGAQETAAEVRAQMGELAELQTQEQARSSQIAGALAGLQKQELAGEGEIEAARAQLQTLQEEVGRIEAERLRLSERVLGLKREVGQAQDQAGILHERRASMLREKEELQGQREALAEKTAAGADEIAAADAARAELEALIGRLEDALQGARSELQAVASERQALAAERGRCESEQSTLSERRGELRRRAAVLELRRGPLAEGVAALDVEVERQAETVGGIRRQILADREGLSHTRRQAQDQADTLADLEQRRSGAAARRQTLQELEDSMAGVYRGVKAVVEGARAGERGCADVVGMVAELLSVPTEWALAIETALGSAQQHIVVRTAEGAREAIDFLKRERAGRATFLPLDRIQGRTRLGRDLRAGAGAVGEAIDLVSYDASLAPAMEHLLAGTLVVESLDDALALREGVARGVRMVTREGDLISPSGAMTGGHDNHQKGGLVTRRSAMEELDGQLCQLGEGVEGARRERDRLLSSIAALDARLQDSETRLEQLEGKLRSQQDERSELRAELQAVEEETKNVVEEIGRLADRLTELDAAGAAAAEGFAALETRARALEERVAGDEQRLLTERGRLREQGEMLTRLRVGHTEATERLSAIVSRLAIIEADTAEQEAQAAVAAQRAQEARAEAAAIEDKVQAAEAQLAEGLAAREAAENALSKQRQAFNELRGELEARREEERSVTKRLRDVADSINALRLREQEAGLHMASLAEKVREELGCDNLAELEARLAAGPGEDDEAADPEFIDEEAEEEETGLEEALSCTELESLVQDIQGRLNRIGAVNHQAIQELAELKARRDFLTSQQEDLDAARGDVDELLERLNRECRRRFDETFERVRENFQLLFRQLFGGGKADLVLSEDEDPLNAGIEIIARPPGKEPTSISLLSGGEKALCAVALLFGIFRSKPSPFCILDEVDGPLDESNIDRYMRTLREFSEQSQFIIITHSKRTMSMVDRIYGVTQSEPGVSRHYSLRFSASGELEEGAGADVA